jgi:predicted dehydrogenase
MTTQLNVGMLGAGFIGSFHSYALSLQSLIRNRLAEIRLGTLADLNEKARTEAQRRFGWERTVESWEVVVSDPMLNVFVNAGPNVLHHAPVLAALKAGKSVFCEKPLAMDAAEAHEMWRAAEAQRAVHQAAFVYRFVPALRYARELISSRVSTSVGGLTRRPPAPARSAI